MSFVPRTLGHPGVVHADHNLGQYAVRNEHGDEMISGGGRVSAEWTAPLPIECDAAMLADLFEDEGALVACVFAPVLYPGGLIWPAIIQRRVTRKKEGQS